MFQMLEFIEINLFNVLKMLNVDDKYKFLKIVFNYIYIYISTKIQKIRNSINLFYISFVLHVFTRMNETNPFDFHPVQYVRSEDKR